MVDRHMDESKRFTLSYLYRHCCVSGRRLALDENASDAAKVVKYRNILEMLLVEKPSKTRLAGLYMGSCGIYCAQLESTPTIYVLRFDVP